MRCRRPIQDWCHLTGVQTLYIEPGSPWQNGFIERFHSRFRDECLNQERRWRLDKHKVFEALADPPQEDSSQALIARRKDAKIQQHGNRKRPPLARDEILRAIRKKGRKGWKQQSGYHRRSLAETLMFRYKQIIGDKRRARDGLISRSKVGWAVRS
ncbi:MAG TPA: hypothetical protein EYQ18_12750 [Candidatus Handelsmanbacteria bacterium]|nr:hypothetical protein [Candidatus Handelsmanbacteria bacterium]